MEKPALIGLISDTHGLLRPEALEALAGSDLIIHAGDIGKLEILEKLRRVAPVVAVKGNIDTQPWAKNLPETETVQARGATLFILHDRKQLGFVPQNVGIDFIIAGHSHKPAHEQQGGTTYINPGAAGPRRFKLPITVAMLDLRRSPHNLKFISLDSTPLPASLFLTDTHPKR